MSSKKSNLKSEIRELHKLLQDALEVEHATIPPYFTAWLSIKEGHNHESKEIIRSVLLEEMLHLTLAANLLNAIDGKPNLTHPDFVPRYPHILPHSGGHFEINIEKFSQSALKVFLQIERPEAKKALPEAEGFDTIGQFYAYVKEKLDKLCDEHGEQKVFCGDINLQIRPEDYYGSGSVVVVTNRNTAHDAIETIVEQGEGAHEGIFDKDHNIFGPGDGKELAHYYRFMEIHLGRHFKKGDTPRSGPHGSPLKVYFDEVYPLSMNMHKSDYPKGSEKRKALEKFSSGYNELLVALEEAFNGHRSGLTEAIARMFSLRNQALSLIQTPLGKGKGTLGLDFTSPTG